MLPDSLALLLILWLQLLLFLIFLIKISCAISKHHKVSGCVLQYFQRMVAPIFYFRILYFAGAHLFCFCFVFYFPFFSVSVFAVSIALVFCFVRGGVFSVFKLFVNFVVTVFCFAVGLYNGVVAVVWSSGIKVQKCHSYSKRIHKLEMWNELSQWPSVRKWRSPRKVTIAAIRCRYLFGVFFARYDYTLCVCVCFRHVLLLSLTLFVCKVAQHFLVWCSNIISIEINKLRSNIMSTLIFLSTIDVVR